MVSKEIGQQEFEKEYPTWMQNEKLRDLYVKLAEQVLQM